MSKEEVIRKFPGKRISPFDGMAITAEVWAEAHEYHHSSQQVHALFSHGPGILIGLDVMASDPPDSSVYILPGIAMDALGQTIVLHEPVAYDLGHSYGFLHLLLAYDESRPQAGNKEPAGSMYICTQFSIEARAALPDTPYVELGRIWRQDRDTPIRDASNPELPVLNEIDLRFRQIVSAKLPQALSIGVSYVGGGANTRHAQGVGHLARFLRQSGLCHTWIDEGVAIDDNLNRYVLLYLVGQDRFQLGQDELKALYAYLQQGGTVFFESCRSNTIEGEPAADTSFADVLASFGLKTEVLPVDHRMLIEPFLFAAPPPGFETGGGGEIRVGEGVIWSTLDYGCLWRGVRRGQIAPRDETRATREEIRAAQEWGSNVIAYALARRRQSADGDGA
ncbi:MAG: DUF4159 domain-containing protein [Anaerolineae bacterium]|nr:DUF4159 domain-containing protein [Anaerolineae bacterium]